MPKAAATSLGSIVFTRNVDALSDLGGKVHTTAANYAAADHGAQQQYQQGA